MLRMHAFFGTFDQDLGAGCGAQKTLNPKPKKP